MPLEFLTPGELSKELGERLRMLRVDKGLEQTELAARAGVSEKSVRRLERGTGSTVDTFLRVLKALNALGGIEALAPKPTVNPLAIVRGLTPTHRVRKRKGEQH